MAIDGTRLLAAVYAELGGAAFEGRHARIAKFYGTEVTDDVVKSFFANEISRAAEDLHGQNPVHRRAKRLVRRKRSGGPLRDDVEEQDVVFIGERNVERASLRPGKRRRFDERFRSVNERLPSPLPQINDPSHIPSRSPTLPPPTRTRRAPKKRPYKKDLEHDLADQTISSSSQIGSRARRRLESGDRSRNASVEVEVVVLD